MRINKFIAQATGLSRRAADQAIIEGKVALNQQPARPGDAVQTSDVVTLDGRPLQLAPKTTTILLNKPIGYVCSRAGQGSRTIYDLLPPELHPLKPVGRLDKDSSGLLLLTNDGQLANELTHPSYAKQKVYEITLDKPLTASDKVKVERGVQIDDYTSRLQLSALKSAQPIIEKRSWRVTMTQGRNRQIRHTFAALDYEVKTLHRTNFGTFALNQLASGSWQALTNA
jgi:pseudouridine synthase